MNPARRAGMYATNVIRTRTALRRRILDRSSVTVGGTLSSTARIQKSLGGAEGVLGVGVGDALDGLFVRQELGGHVLVTDGRRDRLRLAEEVHHRFLDQPLLAV